MFFCKYCTRFFSGQGGLTQHLDKKKECCDKYNKEHGITVRESKDASENTVVPDRRKQQVYNDLPFLNPANKVARPPNMGARPPNRAALPPKRAGMPGGPLASFARRPPDKRKSPPPASVEKMPPQKKAATTSGKADAAPRMPETARQEYINQVRLHDLAAWKEFMMEERQRRGKLGNPEERAAKLRAVDPDLYEAVKDMPLSTENQVDDTGGFSMLDDDDSEYELIEQATVTRESHSAEANQQVAPAQDDSGTTVDEHPEQVPNGQVLNEHVLPGEDDWNNDGYLNVGVNNKMCADFRDYCDKWQNTYEPNLTKKQVTAIKLLDLLRRKKASLDTYPEVMLWHLQESGQIGHYETLKEAGQRGLYINRTKLINELAERYHMQAMFAKKVPTTLPFSKAEVDLVCYNIWGIMEGFFTDPRLTDDDFDFYDNDPRKAPPDDYPLIGSLITGKAHREACKQYKKAENQIPLPIVMYIDGADTGEMKNMPITALTMTLGIFKRQYRNQDHAWKTLGYVSSVSAEKTMAKKIFKQSKHVDNGDQGRTSNDPEPNHTNNEGSTRKLPSDPAGPSKDLHKMLDVILRSYLEMQKKGFKWDLRYRGKTYKNLEFIPYVIFVKCDNQEADQLCGSFTSRSHGVKQLCRYCICPTEDTHNPQADYIKKSVSLIKPLADAKDIEGLRQMSQQCIDNAWYKVRFSPAIEARSIHGASPADMLHTNLLGTMMMHRDVFYEQIGHSSALAEEIDNLSQLYGMQTARQSERDMPKCKFTSGIREGKLNAKEYRGVLLVMAAMLRSTQGRESISKQDGFSTQKTKDWAELVEVLLGWEAYLCQEEITLNQIERLELRNRFLMWTIKKVANRKKGMGLRLLKYHAIVHLAYDIILYGVPMEFDTGINESQHKARKIAARMTQKNPLLFDWQTAKRTDEFAIVDMAMLEVEGYKLWEYFNKPEQELADALPDPTEIVTTGARIRVFKDAEKDGELRYSVGTGKELKRPRQEYWDRDILPFLDELQAKLKKWIPSLEIRAEHKRKGQIFRGHPNYRGLGHWRDWVLVDWGGQTGVQPAQIWCFVVLEGLPQSRKKKAKYADRLSHGRVPCLEDGVYAVAECASFVDTEENNTFSYIFRRLKKELASSFTTSTARRRRFYLIDTEAFVDPCFVIPDIGSKDQVSYFQVKSRAEWAGVFEKWMDKALPKEYENDKAGVQFE